MNASAKVGLVGCGYSGKNLCRNFKSLGALGMVVDSTQSGKETATELAPGVPVSSSFDALWATTRFMQLPLRLLPRLMPRFRSRRWRLAKTFLWKNPWR